MRWNSHSTIAVDTIMLTQSALKNPDQAYQHSERHKVTCNIAETVVTGDMGKELLTPMQRPLISSETGLKLLL